MTLFRLVWTPVLVASVLFIAMAGQQKSITDVEEYEAYVAALNQQSPSQKATSLESFLRNYPNSVMREEALEGLMRASQQLGNSQKAAVFAHQLLQVNPDNLLAVVILTVTASARNLPASQALADAEQCGQTCNTRSTNSASRISVDQYVKKYAA